MIHYRVEPLDLHAHLFRVTLTIAHPQPDARAGLRLSLPVWIPGSYLVREFARHIERIEARQGGRKLAVDKLDKASWRARPIDPTGTEPLEIVCEVYAFDTSVRAAYLDAARGFFNGTCLCLRVEGRESEPHQLELRGLPSGWEVATALTPVKVDRRGQGLYQAPSYDELVDHPVEMGAFWRGRFKACGVPHEFVVAGVPPSFDSNRLLADVRRICETEIRFWHGSAGGSVRKPPFDRYVFMLNAVDDGYGGLEHRASTALIASRRDLPRTVSSDGSSVGSSVDKINPKNDGYVTLLGLISHEYFHTWNVKRLRPAEFASVDYTQENYTQLLWFFEGFTSYYDDLLLLRSGLIDEAQYLKLLAKTIHRVDASPGRRLQSVAQASFDAWIKYYRQDENTPNLTVSYYNKGALVALALDLSLRRERRGTLDEVMRALWRRAAGGPVTQTDIAEALAEVGGRAFGKELAQWVHGTGELPLPPLLASMGLTLDREPATMAQRWGVRVAEGSPLRVKSVLRGSPAHRAGLAAGDEMLALNDWRLRKLDDAELYAPGARSQLLVARDQRVLRLELVLPRASAAFRAGAYRLRSDEQAPRAALAMRRAWLNERD